MKPSRTPRWRCGDPGCWAHTWQPVTATGEYGPVDVATGELEAHWVTEHGGWGVTTKPTPGSGRWLIAGTSTARRYPCVCVLGQACRGTYRWRGRPDAADMPTRCCARRAHDTEQRGKERPAR